jgi:hypothetical protein
MMFEASQYLDESKSLKYINHALASQESSDPFAIWRNYGEQKRYNALNAISPLAGRQLSLSQFMASEPHGDGVD